MFRDETGKVKKKFEEGYSGNDTDAAGPSSTGTPIASPGAAVTTPDSALSAASGQSQFSQLSRFSQPSSFQDTLGQSQASQDARSKRTTAPRKQNAKQNAKQKDTLVSSTSNSLDSLVSGDQVPMQQSLILAPRRTAAERGFQFFMDHYLYGHPESPRNSGDIATDIPWILDPAAHTVASAVGLAGMANLAGDKQMQLSASQTYVNGLRMTAQSLSKADLATVNNDMRSIVLLAMFEVSRRGSRRFASVPSRDS